jgi:hypothetical protein
MCLRGARRRSIRWWRCDTSNRSQIPQHDSHVAEADHAEKVLDVSVLQATRDAYTWVTQYTKTYNEHWEEEGRSSPCAPFPPYEYFDSSFCLFDAKRIHFIEKSRELMVTEILLVT